MEKEIKEITKQLIELGIYENEVEFGCFSDSVFSYYIINEYEIHEINIISDNTLMKRMAVSEIINLSRLYYFEYKQFIGGDVYNRIVYRDGKIVELV